MTGVSRPSADGLLYRTRQIGKVEGIMEMVLSRFSSGLFRAMFAMKEIENGKEIPSYA
jgi:hypothetical protein